MLPSNRDSLGLIELADKPLTIYTTGQKPDPNLIAPEVGRNPYYNGTFLCRTL
jgi:hypothetical protein